MWKLEFLNFGIYVKIQLPPVNSCVCCRKSKFRSCEAVVGAVNHVFRATDEDFEMVEIGRKMYFQSRRKLRYWQCEYRAAKWEVKQKHKKTYISPATERTVSIYLICILGDRNGKNVSNLYNEWTFHGGDEFSHHRHGERRIRWGQGFIYFIFLWLDIFIKRPFVTMPPLWILLWVAAVVAVKCIFLIGLIVSHGVKICRGGLQSPSLIAPDKMETILLWKWKVSIRCLHNLDDFINQPCHDSLWLFRYNVQ